jgi:transposase
VTAEAGTGQRRIGQTSLAEALLPAGVGSNRRLERIAGLIDWAPMERLLAPLRAPTGRSGYPPLALFRALLLAQWYQLFDPGLEEALADRLSFRRFCGVGLDEGTPDETTLCRFRAALAERGLTQALFAELNRQLDAKGLMLKAGTLIDAILVEAAVSRPPLSEGEVSTKDPDAGFTRRGQRSFFGFKAHVAVDLGSDLIRDAVLTGADVPAGRPSVSATASPPMAWCRATRRRCSWARPMTARPGARRWPKPASSTASCIAAMRAARSHRGSAG